MLFFFVCFYVPPVSRLRVGRSLFVGSHHSAKIFRLCSYYIVGFISLNNQIYGVQDELYINMVELLHEKKYNELNYNRLHKNQDIILFSRKTKNDVIRQKNSKPNSKFYFLVRMSIFLK